MMIRVAIVATAVAVAVLPGGATLADPYGLDQRPANTTCLAPARPSTSGINVVRLFPAAPAFTMPTKILQAPGDATRWYVAEKTGLIKVFDVTDPAVVTTYLDLTGVVNSDGPEAGLLGFAFHPDFPATPEVFVTYVTGVADMSLAIHIVRIVLDDPLQPLNPTTQVLIAIDHHGTDFHFAGEVAFGPDGYLYVSVGDGGGAANPSNPDNAQNTHNLLGSVLRIDVLGVPWPSPGYNIPADNPFAANPKCGPGDNDASCPELYAWGFRNPWRWSFDRDTGTLWLGDVGQSTYEEVDIVQPGGNYGWRCREGLHPYNTTGCPDGPFVDPVAEYPHVEIVNGQTKYNVAVLGGYVYHGSAIPSLRGRYIFGDFSVGRLFSLRSDGAGGYIRDELFVAGRAISTFATGEDGELYLADVNNGRIYKIVPGGSGSDPVPTLLSQTGCVNPGDPTQPADGVIPYDINAPFWSDGAVKSRWLAIPDGQTITVDSSGDWDLPPRSILVKLFRLNGRPIETRLLMRHPDGQWRGYTYEWNDTLTDAVRVTGGKTKIIDGQEWIYPSESQCLACHTAAAGFSLGLETAQLNRDLTYPVTGWTANELATLEHIGMFSAPLPGAPATLPALPDPADGTQWPEPRSRAWLHTNCSQCHRPGGPTPASMDLRYSTPFAATGTCDAAPGSGTLGIPDAKLLLPGDATHSVIPARAGRRDAFGMPPLASNLVDSAAVSVVTQWINSRASCTDADSDGVDDGVDNCVFAKNADQRDTNLDGYGNACDADLNNSGLVTTADYSILRNLLNTSDPDADLNGSGSVTVSDYTILRNLLNRRPGPSALLP